MYDSPKAWMPTFYLAPARYASAAKSFFLHTAIPMDYHAGMLNTIAELPAYRSFAEKHLSDDERQAIIDYLAEHPKSGDVMRGTGGVRKLRWGKGGRGKSGGVRVIYYFHDERLPLYLLTLFAKNEQANLTAKERNMLATLVDTLIATALERN
jgi:hypothetical protein